MVGWVFIVVKLSSFMVYFWEIVASNNFYLLSYFFLQSYIEFAGTTVEERKLPPMQYNFVFVFGDLPHKRQAGLQSHTFSNECF